MTNEQVAMVADVLGDNPALHAIDRQGLEALARHMRLERHPSSSTIIRQGDRDRILYFVVDGYAQVMSGAVHLGPVERGEHFGELALMDGAPRSATVVAYTDVVLARLDLPHYAALAADDPALALAFTHALIGGIAGRLRGTTESLRAALGRVPRRTRVTVRTGGRTCSARTGTPLGELLPERVGDHPVVAALVDRRAQSLVQPTTYDSDLEPLATDHWEGRRVYRTSLGLLLLEAAQVVDAALILSLDHSVGFAQWVVVNGIGSFDPNDLAAELHRAMLEVAKDDRKLNEAIWRVEEARDHFHSRGLAGPAALLRTWREPMVPIVSYGQVLALKMSPLVPRTGMLHGFGVVPDQHDGLLLVYGRAGTSPNSPGGSAYPDTHLKPNNHREALDTSRSSRALTGEHHRWLDVLGIASVGEFNLRCIGGRVSELIHVVEGYQEKRISQIADAIDARGDVRLVCVAGPSSSGKTTFIKRLKIQLEVVGIKPREISLDNYYVDRADTPRDDDGDYDFEAFEALLVELLGEHLRALLSGQEVTLPRYDFRAGRSLPGMGETLQLGEREVLLIEGIHALNPGLLPQLPSSDVFRIFLCPLAQLPFDPLNRVHASDVRLLRRIVRDRYRRGADAAANIARWPSVRRGERLHIFPYQREADEVFDSSLIYEMSVLKVYAERYLLEVPQDHPSYTTAFRLLGLLDQFVTIYPDHVPPTSILREFIGGSGFHY